MPGATSSVLAPSSDGLQPNSDGLHLECQELLVASLLLVASKLQNSTVVPHSCLAAVASSGLLWLLDLFANGSNTLLESIVYVCVSPIICQGLEHAKIL